MLMSMDDIRQMNKRKELENAEAQAPAPGPSPAPESAQDRLGLLKMPQAPVAPGQQFRDKHGTGGSILRLLGTGLSGGLLGDTLIPELGKDSRLQYASDMKNYGTAMQDYNKQSGFRDMLTGVMDGVEDESDPFSRLSLAKEFGLEPLEYATGGGVVPHKPAWEKVDIDGQYFYTDKNDPTAAPVPVTMEDGTFAYSDLTEGQAKNVNYFERGAPRILQMHRMEDAGVTLPRTVLQAVARAENTDTGFVDQAIFAQLLNKIGLSPDQREYLDAATDFSMVNLRKDSGAAISASEMIKELKNTVMLDDMSPSHYKENREARRTRATALIAGMPRRVQKKYKDKLGELNGLSLDRAIAEIEKEAKSYGVLREDSNDWTPPTLDEIMAR
jgi:hypothetical protein